MAEAATVLEGKQFLSSEERSEFECRICRFEVTELRILPCGHEFCAKCIDESRSKGNGSCPYCRKWIPNEAIHYPKKSNDSELQERNDECEVKQEVSCQIKGCGRSVDYYCVTCKLFICHRCSLKNKCTSSEKGHAVRDTINDLLPLARDMFADWKKKKEGRAEQLHSQIVQLANGFTKWAEANTENTTNAAQDMVQKIRELNDLAVEKAGELVPLEHYDGKVDKISETDLIQLVQRMSTDNVEKREQANDSIKSKELSNIKEYIKGTSTTDQSDQCINNSTNGKGLTNIVENIKDPLVSAQPVLSDTKDMKGTLEQLTDDPSSIQQATNLSKSDVVPRVLMPPDIYPEDDDSHHERLTGYLPNLVEEHKASQCRYLRSRAHTYKMSACMGTITYDEFILTRDCLCGSHMNGGQEKHYSRKCQWRKVRDALTGHVYLVRRCYCAKPPGA